MQGNSEVVDLYEFGDFRLDRVTRTLWRDEELIALPPKVFDTLCVLIEKHGKIVSKQELLDLVWADSFVEESNLTQNIYTLRRALGVDENDKSYIETLSRKGYRFTAEVREVRSNGAAAKVEHTDSPDEPVPDAQPPAKVSNARLKWAFSILAGASVLCLITFLGYSLVRSKWNDGKMTASSKIDFRQLTFSRDISWPVISPTGEVFAFLRNGEIVVQEIDTERVVKLDFPKERQISALQFSPDGRMIGYRNQKAVLLPGDVFQVSRFGGQPQKIASDVWSGFSFSPNGVFVTFVRRFPNSTRQSLIVRNINSGEEREAGALDFPMRFIQVGTPSWSPDGTKISVAVSNQIIQIAASYLAVFDVKTGAMEEFKIPKFIQVGQTMWLPDGNSIAVIARENKKLLQVWEVAYPQGTHRHITNDGGTYRTLSMSSDGKRILTGQFATFSHIWTLKNDDPDTAAQVTFGNMNRDGVVGLCLLPNGEIVYSSRVTGTLNLWKMDPRSGERKQLTNNEGEVNSQPAISPDGKYVYFNSNRTGSNQIWRIDSANGENPTQITFGGDEGALFPQVSPDGTRIYYIKNPGRKASVWQKSLVDGKDEILLVEGVLTPGDSLSLSPNGKLLATCNMAEKTNDDSDEGNFQAAVVSTEMISKPMFYSVNSCDIVWNADGESIEYVENTDDGARIWRQTINSDGKPKLVLELMDAKITNFARSADGKLTAFSNRTDSMDAMLLTNVR